MRSPGLAMLVLLVFISSTTVVNSQVTAPGFDPVALEIKPVTRSVPRPITSMDLLTIRDITGIQISPDGKQVAYVVSQAVLDSNSYRTALFVVGIEGGSVPVNLGSAGPPHWNRAGVYMRIAPQWSPDSRFITYLVAEKDRKQIWQWSIKDGKPEQLTHNAGDIDTYEWKRDGNQIIFTTVDPISPDEIKRVSEQGILYNSRSISGFRGSIRAWEGRPIARAAIEARPAKTKRWVYDFATRTERKFTPEEDVEYNKLHPPPSINIPGEKSYVRILKPSPDGKLLAYVSQLNDPNKSSAHWTVSVKTTDGKQLHELVPPTSEFILTLWWGGNKIYFTRLSEDRGPVLYAVAANGGPAQEVIKNNKDIISDLSFNEDASRAVCLRETSTTPPEIAIIDIKENISRTLVNVNPEFQNIALSQPTRLEWTNKYGDRAFGYFLKPLNYERGKRYPLIVTTYYARTFLRGDAGDEYPLQVFAANNFAVLSIDLLNADLRVSKPGDFRDAMLRWYSPMATLEQATKTLDEMGIVEAGRKGLAGLSYGAEVTCFTISHSDLFQAAVATGASARDPLFYYLAHGWWRRQFSLWGLDSPEGTAAERWRELSPALNAARVNAPLLINSSDSEYIFSLQFYTSLLELNKPVELFIYADEGHIKNQPKHRYEIYQRNLDWFSFWLQDRADATPEKAEQYSRWRAMRTVLKENRPATP